MLIYRKLLPDSLRSSIKNQVVEVYQERVTPTPERVIIAGWQGSGSTFVYQVATLLALDVVKIHGQWKDERRERVLFTIRDPRDIICNRAQRANSELWAAGDYESALLDSVDYFAKGSFIADLDSSLEQSNTTIIRYETFFGGQEKTLIHWIADQFLLDLDPQKLQMIMNETSIPANQARAESFGDFSSFDQESQIHGQHITNRGRFGAWRIWFTPAVCEEVKQCLGESLIRLGYEKNLDWFADGK